LVTMILGTFHLAKTLERVLINLFEVKACLLLSYDLEELAQPFFSHFHHPNFCYYLRTYSSTAIH
jgi:hypothetical protein